MSFKPNDGIYLQGDPAADMAYILSGRVALERPGIKDWGRKGVARRCTPTETIFTEDLKGPGDLIGLEGLLDHVYSSSAVAEEPTLLVAFPTEIFTKVMSDGPDFTELLFEMQRRGQQQAEQNTHLQKHGNTPQRLTGAVLLYNRFANDEGFVSVTHTQLAQKAGTSRESVYKRYGLPFLIRKNCIEVELDSNVGDEADNRRKIKVTDREKLKDLTRI